MKFLLSYFSFVLAFILVSIRKNLDSSFFFFFIEYSLISGLGGWGVKIGDIKIYYFKETFCFILIQDPLTILFAIFPHTLINGNNFLLFSLFMYGGFFIICFFAVSIILIVQPFTVIKSIGIVPNLQSNSFLNHFVRSYPIITLRHLIKLYNILKNKKNIFIFFCKLYFLKFFQIYFYSF